MINDSFTQGNELSFSWKIVEFSQMKIYVIWNHISFGNKKKRNLSCWISSKNIKCARKYPALVKLISSQMCTWHVESHMAPAIRYTHQWYISLYYMWTYSALANGFDWIVRIGPHEVDGGDRLLIIALQVPKDRARVIIITHKQSIFYEIYCSHHWWTGIIIIEAISTNPNFIQ